MSSKRYFALVLGALALAACGNKNGTGTGGSGTTTATSVSASNTTGSSKVTASSSSGTGGASSGNHTPGTATSIKVNDGGVQATLLGASGKKNLDWYSFTAKANERIALIMSPQSQLPAPDPTVVDTAFFLYDSTIATNPGASPLTVQSGSWPSGSAGPNGSLLFVQIPADGTYYVSVGDCNAVFSSGCPNPAAGVTTLDYGFAVIDTSQLANPELVANSATQDGTTTNADTVTYKKGTTAGSYYDNVIGGRFKSAADTHVFKFTPPQDAMLPNPGAQTRLDFYVQANGTYFSSDLSASNIKVWVTDSLGAILSRADQTNYPIDSTHFAFDFSVPYTVGQTYFLYVQNTHSGGSPTTDFYFIDAYLNADYDEAETQTVSAPPPGTSQKLNPLGTAKSFYVIDGTLSPFTETDWFNLAIPGGVTKFAYYCDAARSGSSLGGFTAQLFSDATTPVSPAQAESATTDLYVPPTAIPAGQAAGATWYLKLTASSQDTSTPLNTGTQYRCAVFFEK